MIPYGRQHISDEDIDAVVEVLRSDYLTQGPVVGAFEALLCQATGSRHAVAMNSATSALHTACLALNLGPGDLVWTTPITFVASANCARLCGADVDFVDIDPSTFNMCASAFELKLERAEACGRLPKLVIPVHMAGQSPDMERIHALARGKGIHIVEDASHAIGANYAGAPVGNCQFSDITVFSFHPVKIITSAEGGAALTNDPEIAQRLAELRSHGITRDPDRMERKLEGPWAYDQIDLGLNYRMTDVHAALGCSQISRLAPFVDRRNDLASRYDDLLTGFPLQLPGRIAGARSSFHLYIVQLNNAAQRLEVFKTLRSAGIGVNVHYMPVHLQPYYRRLGFEPGDYPAAESYYARAITLPIYPGLSEANQDFVTETLRNALTIAQ